MSLLQWNRNTQRANKGSEIDYVYKKKEIIKNVRRRTKKN